MKRCLACPACTPCQVLAVALHTSLLSVHMAPWSPSAQCSQALWSQVCSVLTVPCGPGSAQRSQCPMVPICSVLTAPRGPRSAQHSMALWSPVCSALTRPRGPGSAQRSHGPVVPICSALTWPCGPRSAQCSHGPVVPGLLSAHMAPWSPVCSALTWSCGPRLLSAHSAPWSLVCSGLTVSSGPHFVQRSKRLREGKSAFRSHSWVQRIKPRVTSWAPLAPGPTEASAQARLGVAASLSGAGGPGGAACSLHTACTSSVQCRVDIHKYLPSDLPLPDETEGGRRLVGSWHSCGLSSPA